MVILHPLWARSEAERWLPGRQARLAACSSKKNLWLLSEPQPYCPLEPTSLTGVPQGQSEAVQSIVIECVRLLFIST